jgi:hypothetical protein
MASTPIESPESLPLQKRRLAAQSDRLREDFHKSCADIEPTVEMLEKGYALARTGQTLWNCSAPMRNGKGWSGLLKTALHFYQRMR